jgi:hypothetical protein
MFKWLLEVSVAIKLPIVSSDTCTTSTQHFSISGLLNRSLDGDDGIVMRWSAPAASARAAHVLPGAAAHQSVHDVPFPAEPSLALGTECCVSASCSPTGFGACTHKQHPRQHVEIVAARRSSCPARQAA